MYNAEYAEPYVDPDECACEFDPYPPEEQEPGFEESWHYHRRCYRCGEWWWSLHCRCEGPRMCSDCAAVVGRVGNGYEEERG